MRTIIINNPGPQGAVGPQGTVGPSGSTQPFSNVSGSIWATTSSLQVTGSFIVSGSSTFTNIGPAVFSGSVNATSGVTMSSAVVSGDVTVLGTASINVLQINTTINSTGSNTLGDSASDTQTLYGSVVIPTGSLTVSGNVSFGTSSAGFYWNNTNNRLGIGTSSPASALHVNGEIRVNAGQAVFLDVSNNIYVLGAGNQFRIYSGGTASLNIATNGNTLIGTTTDTGYKLNVSGSVIIRGSGSTSATDALVVQNNIGTNLLTIKNANDAGAYNLYAPGGGRFGQMEIVDTTIGAGGGANVFFPYNRILFGGNTGTNASAQVQIDSTTRGFLPPRTNTTASISSPAQGLMTYLTGSTDEGLYYYNSGSQVGWHRILTNTGSQSITGSLSISGVTTFAQGSSVNGSGNLSIGAFSIHGGFGYATFSQTTLLLTGGTFTSTTGTQTGLSFTGGFAPTSGTATYSGFSILPTINQTGGANGITRGLFINPTLTSAVDFRAIETTAGNVLFQSGSTPLLFVSSSGNVGIGTTSSLVSLDIRATNNSAITPLSVVPNNATTLLVGNTGTNGVLAFGHDNIGQGWIQGRSRLGNGTSETILLNPLGGNVGIGSASAAYKLQVVGGDIALDFNRYLRGGFDNNWNLINLYNGSTGDLEMFMFNTNWYLRHNANATFAGNVGIGLTGSISNRLHVRGSGATSATRALRVENTNASASLVVLDNGYVGINTGSAEYNLDVNGTLRTSGFIYSNAYATSVQRLQFNNGVISGNIGYVKGISDGVIQLADVSEGDFNRLQFGGATTSYPALKRSGSSLCVVDATGGTNTSLLVGLSGSAYGSTGTSNGKLTINNTSGNNGLAIRTGETGYQLGIRTTVNDNIGTEFVWYDGGTATFLQYGGAIGARLGASTNAQFRATNTDSSATIHTGGTTERLRVTSTGLVGIGTSSPSASLHVAGTTRLSGSFNTAASGSILTVVGSGSALPIFTVQGSQGELFSIVDSLSGSLFSVNDISGLPILEVFSDGTTLIGDYQDPALITTTKKTANTGVTTIYSLPTASYDGAWFDYTIRSGSDARVGTIMGMWSGSSVNYMETSASQFGNTSGFTFGMNISGSNMILSGSATTSGWTVKTIIRSI